MSIQLHLAESMYRMLFPGPNNGAELQLLHLLFQQLNRLVHNQDVFGPVDWNKYYVNLANLV